MPTNRRNQKAGPGSRPAHPRRRSRRMRRLSVRTELKNQPDTRRIARTVIELALAQAEAEAAAQTRREATKEHR